jgi:hypothetical protein
MLTYTWQLSGNKYKLSRFASFTLMWTKSKSISIVVSLLVALPHITMAVRVKKFNGNMWQCNQQGKFHISCQDIIYFICIYFRLISFSSRLSFMVICGNATNKVNFIYYFFKLNYNFVILKNINYNLLLYYLFISDLWRN